MALSMFYWKVPFLMAGLILLIHIGADQQNFGNYKYQSINEFYKMGTLLSKAEACKNLNLQSAEVRSKV